MKRRTMLAGTAAGLLAAGAATSGWAFFHTPEESGAIFSGREDGVAIKGTDPVGYFTEGRAVRGSADHALEWNGATWHFASAQNRALFEANPEKYAPKYGGYCAYAAANGQRAKIEPDAWSIVDGRLYLNYDRNIRSRWEADKASYIAAADREWPKIAAE